MKNQHSLLITRKCQLTRTTAESRPEPADSECGTRSTIKFERAAHYFGMPVFRALGLKIGDVFEP
jgi:hypothetical protein